VQDTAALVKTVVQAKKLELKQLILDKSNQRIRSGTPSLHLRCKIKITLHEMHGPALAIDPSFGIAIFCYTRNDVQQ